MNEPDLIERVLLVALSSAQYDVKKFGERLREESATMRDCQKLLAEAKAALAAYQRIKALPEKWEQYGPADAEVNEYCVEDICARELQSALRGEGEAMRPKLARDMDTQCTRRMYYQRGYWRCQFEDGHEGMHETSRGISFANKRELKKMLKVECGAEPAKGSK